MRSATLAEYRAETEALAQALRNHEHMDMPCPACQCEEAKAMRKELKERRQAIKDWFAPAPDADSLF